MRRVTSFIVLGLAASVFAVAPSISSATNAPDPTGAADILIGTFDDNLLGYSVFSEQGANARVIGQYRRLRDNRSYFTVAYGNKNCDPAQAFPVGPFVTDNHGRGRLNVTVALPPAVDLGASGSVSVRRGDNDSDIDGDKLTGPTDVVAVAGKPKIGLIECDSSPTIFGG